MPESGGSFCVWGRVDLEELRAENKNTILKNRTSKFTTPLRDTKKILGIIRKSQAQRGGKNDE